jgi:tryptophan synthase alpha chain
MITFSKKPGLVVYVTAGDPNLAVTRDIALAVIDAGADVLELGVPFSDPLADGPAIQAASQRALLGGTSPPGGTSLNDVLALAAELRRLRPAAGIIAFSYLNPVWRLGMREFCERAAEAGLDGALLTDLTVEEADEYLQLARLHTLATVFLAAPTSTEERLKKIAEVSTGFVYAVSRTGVTGAQQQMSGDAESLVLRLRRYTEVPIAVGFGISTREQVQAVGKFADAAVVGSALVTAAHNAGARNAARVAGDFVRTLRGEPGARYPHG